jgi:hypothetical protein
MAGENRQSHGARARNKPERDERPTEPRGAEARAYLTLSCMTTGSASAKTTETLQVGLDAHGRVASAAATGDDSVAARCLESAARRWGISDKFPKLGAETLTSAFPDRPR